MNQRSKKITLDGINKSTMNKICRYAFGDDFISMEMDVKKMFYMVIVTEQVKKEKKIHFEKHFTQAKIFTVLDRPSTED